MVKWKVYISSTFRDLKEYRADLVNLFQNQLKNNFELSEIMERMFDDGTYTPFLDDCVEAVLESDIYIIILGNRVGSFPPNEERTYTEIELDTALANDKRIFCLRLEQFDESDIDNKAKHDELLEKFKGRPIHTFKDVKEIKSALYEFLIQYTSQSPVNAKNPYKGLASFNVEDGNYFFGRDVEIESCLKKIVTSSGNFFMSVIGNSGTGKSSFVKAGLMFRLENKKEYGFTKRKQILVTPGSEPFINLKYQMQLQGISIEDLFNPNTDSPDIIIFFDQFEEVITQCHTPEAQEERKQLFQFLDKLASYENENSKILFICTFRSDFLSQLANFDFIKSHQYIFPISSLDYKVHADNWEQSITEIITKPALKNGVTIENELVGQMLEQIKEVDGSLPILQFTLERIWNEETIADRRVSSTEFNKLSEGKGISGIIETHAENVINSITKKGQDKQKEAILKTIFVNLVEVNDSLNDVKRTASKDELYSILNLYPEQEVNEVFETLVSEKSRLLNVGQDKDKNIKVDIIHEELLRKWQRLKAWIDERREALETKKRISLDIAAFNKGEEGLYTKRQLKRANQWKTNNPDLSNEEINSFLQNSRKTNNNKLYKNSGLAVIIVAVITTVIFVWVQPYIQKRDFIGTIQDTQLKKEIEARGINAVTELNINGYNYATLKGNLKHFKNLKIITFSEVKNLVDLSIFENTSSTSLDSLYISKNVYLTSLAGIENLNNLKSLTIANNYNLTSLVDIENLSSLCFLTILDNPNLKSLPSFDNLNKLISLTISNNTNFNSLADIENLNNLQSLTISDNSELTSLIGIENLSNLQSLTISYNSELTSLAGIENLSNLQSFSIGYNYNLTSLAGIENLNKLSSLTIIDNDALTGLPNIENLNNLKSLTIADNYNLTSLAGIENLSKLEALEIDGNINLTSLTDSENFKNLKSLTISNNTNFNSLADIENLSNLQSLSIDDNYNLTSLAGIENFNNLQSLKILNNEKLASLAGVENLSKLLTLTIDQNTSLTSLAGIENLSNLQSLTIADNSNLTSLAGIENLSNLQSLNIWSCNNLTSLAGIENLSKLQSLTILYNYNLLSLTGIENLSNLQSLIITYNQGLTILPGIENASKLKSLTIRFNGPITNLKEIENLSSLDTLIVDRNMNLKFDIIRKNNPGIKIIVE